MKNFNVDEICECVREHSQNVIYRTFLYYVIKKHFKDKDINKIVKFNNTENLQKLAKCYDDNFQKLYQKCDMIAVWKDWPTKLFVSNVFNCEKYIKNIEKKPLKKFQKINLKFISGTKINKKIVNKFVDKLLCKNSKKINNNFDDLFLK